MNVTVLED